MCSFCLPFHFSSGTAPSLNGQLTVLLYFVSLTLTHAAFCTLALSSHQISQKFPRFFNRTWVSFQTKNKRYTANIKELMNAHSSIASMLTNIRIPIYLYRVNCPDKGEKFSRHPQCECCNICEIYSTVIPFLSSSFISFTFLYLFSDLVVHILDFQLVIAQVKQCYVTSLYILAISHPTLEPYFLHDERGNRCREVS